MTSDPHQGLSVLQRDITECQICAAHLPLGPRPVVQFSMHSRVAIIGQAPGSKVHASGVPWDDASGDHLRSWLSIDRETFYDPNRFALVPMGFCYPGRGRSGDAPPRPECAPTWHEPIFSLMRQRPLIVLCGQYALRHYLGARRRPTLTETVRHFEDYGPEIIPLPHPSWRSKNWMKKNPWFEAEVLPVLRDRVQAQLDFRITK